VLRPGALAPELDSKDRALMVKMERIRKSYDMTVNFALTAHHQSSGDVGTAWTLAPNSILHLTQASASKVFISGNAA
jgi:hypothetical protein